MVKILCVGQKSIFNNDLLQTLEFEGYDVDVIQDVDTALQKITNEHSALIVCDIEMLAVSNFQLLKSLKTNDAEVTYAPFVYVGQIDKKSDIIKALNLRAGDFIPLPLDKDIFLAQVHSKITEVQYTKDQLTPQKTHNNYLNFYMLINEVKESLHYIEKISGVMAKIEPDSGDLNEYAEFAQQIYETSHNLLELISESMHQDSETRYSA